MDRFYFFFAAFEDLLVKHLYIQGVTPANSKMPQYANSYEVCGQLLINYRPRETTKTRKNAVRRARIFK